MLRTPLPAAQLDAPGVVAAYKNLKTSNATSGRSRLMTWTCARCSTTSKTRPLPRADLHARLLLTWHLRRVWAPLTFTDENPPAPANPVAPARRSAAAQAKASAQQDAAGRPYRSFRGLLDHLATLTRNQVRFASATATVPILAEPPAPSARPST